MNILLIPSWYPILEGDLSGIFFKEQAMLLTERGGFRFHTIVWGQERSYESIRNPFKVIAGAITTPFAHVTVSEPVRGFFEYRFKATTWNEDLLSGNTAAIASRIVGILPDIEKVNGRIDVVHAHVAYPGGLIAQKVSKKTGIPYIVTEHMGPFPFPRFLFSDGTLKRVISDAYSSASRVTAVSRSLALRMNDFGIRVHNITPNFIDENKFSSNTEYVSESPAEKSVLTVCSLKPEKGIEDYLDAIAAAIRINPSASDGFVFRIAGDGHPTYKRFLNEKVARLGLEERVIFLGPLSRQEAMIEFSKCTFFALTSRHESFGIVYIEALASGKPILATDCGGPADIVSENNGFLVKVGAPLSIAHGLIHLFKNIDRFDPVAIREFFLSHFSAITGVAQWRAIYESVANFKE